MFTLTEIETACGVTLPAVQSTRNAGLVITDDTGRAFIAPDVAPSLAGAAARFALGGPVRFAGFNRLSLPVYRLKVQG